MQPNQYNQEYEDTIQPAPKKRGFILFAVGMIGLIILLLGLSAYRSSQFRLVGVTPNLNNVATLTPSITLNFNRNLGSLNDLKLTATANVVQDAKVNGKSIIVTFKPP